jgi:hypothetical protein
LWVSGWIRANPHLSGVCLHIGWKDIEKEPGHLDFSAIDKAVAVLRRIGMKYVDLHLSFFERIIDYGVSKYAERFTIQNCQLSGRKEDTGLQSYDLVQKYRDRAHHGFQSVAGFSHSGERMGSIEMAVLNIVHADGEYWELWRGDGLNTQITAAVANAWGEARKLGYDAYKQKLIAPSFP